MEPSKPGSVLADISLCVQTRGHPASNGLSRDYREVDDDRVHWTCTTQGFHRSALQRKSVSSYLTISTLPAPCGTSAVYFLLYYSLALEAFTPLITAHFRSMRHRGLAGTLLYRARTFLPDLRRSNQPDSIRQIYSTIKQVKSQGSVII